MSAMSARTASIPSAHHGLAERLALWILARGERRRAEELERIGWDLEARHERRVGAGADREHHVVLPPGGGLF